MHDTYTKSERLGVGIKWLISVKLIFNTNYDDHAIVSLLYELNTGQNGKIYVFWYVF